MSENREERTDNLGLLALMQSSAGGGPSSDAQGWGFPYWNQVWLDALVAALHEAPRTGVELLTAPSTGPTLQLSTTSGYLPAGLTLEVCQTWVDEWGRETNAGTVSEISTGDPITDPDTAPSLGTPTPAASGFDGGLLEVAYSWIDEAAGETLSSPVASVSVPYRTGGLQSEVVVTLPATPASVGAAGAFIYARHRSGNWVRAAVISDPDEDEVTLDGTWVNCFVALPLANSTGSNVAIDITGISAPSADAVLTRFYVRAKGSEWYDADARLKLDGVDEWDPTTVSYPLVYTGAVGELVPGYPPPVSQVKPIRQIDLDTEVDGVLAKEHLEASGVAVRTADVAGGVVDWAGALAEGGDAHGELVLVIPEYQGARMERQAVLFWWNANLVTPAWQVLLPVLPTEEWSDTPYTPYHELPGTMHLMQQAEGGRYFLHVQHGDEVYERIPLTLWYKNGLGDYLGFFGVYDDFESLDAEGEPWNSDYCMAYVIDTKSWWRYIFGDAGYSQSGASPSTNLSGGTDNSLQISVDGDAAETVTLALANCTSGSAIAEELQTKIRALGGNKAGVTVEYTGGLYVITSPTHRATSAVVVTDATSNNAADDLKLGVTNGGTENTGTGGWTEEGTTRSGETIADSTTDMSSDAFAEELQGKINNILAALRAAGVIDS